MSEEDLTAELMVYEDADPEEGEVHVVIILT